MKRGERIINGHWGVDGHFHGVPYGGGPATVDCGPGKTIRKTVRRSGQVPTEEEVVVLKNGRQFALGGGFTEVEPVTESTAVKPI